MTALPGTRTSAPGRTDPAARSAVWKGRRTLVCFGLGQIGLLSATPFMTRLMPVADVAAYQIAFAIAIIAQPVATLRLELVVPVRPLASARSLNFRANVVLVATAAATSVVGLLFSVAFGAYPGQLCWTAAAIVLSLGSTALDNAWLIRLGRYRKAALRNVATGSLSGVCQVAAALYLTGPVALGVAMVVGRVFAVALTTGVDRRVPTPFDAESGTTDAYTARRAASSILALSLSSVALQAPVILCSAILGTVAGGFISLAQRIAGVPGSLMSQGVAQHVTAQASQIVRSGEHGLTAYVNKTSRVLVLIGLLFAALLAGTGPWLVPFVFGERWSTSGTLLAVLALPFGLQLVIMPMLAIFGLVGRESKILVLQVCRAIGVGLSVAIGATVTRDLYATAAVATAAITVSYLSIVVSARRTARAHDERRVQAPASLAASAAP